MQPAFADEVLSSAQQTAAPVRPAERSRLRRAAGAHCGIRALKKTQDGCQRARLLGRAACCAAQVAQHIGPTAQAPHVFAALQRALHGRQQLACGAAAGV